MHDDDVTPLSRAALLALADACVVCGLCVPHCPTYRKTGHEADGPRGRIQLMRAVLREELPANARVHEHLDLCLSCRACEAACPNQVPYARLLDGFRALNPARYRRARWFDRPLSWMVRHPASWSLAASLLAVGQRVPGVARGLRQTGVPTLPLSAAFKAEYTPNGACRGTVGLFLGCVSRLADRTVLQAAISVLLAAGFRVKIPSGQGCCGALDLHQGQAAAAQQMMVRNQAAFAGCERVLFVATGCGATLQDYPAYGVENMPVEDVLAFLARHGVALRFKGSEQSVFLHTPCSQRNTVKSVVATEQLLRQIPGLTLNALPGNDQCCGAAGRYHLDQPEMAERLRADKLAAIRRSGAEFILSANVGCLLWLRPVLPKIMLQHPLEFLAAHLES